MAKKKKIKTRGKLQLSRYFQEFKEGDSVAVVEEQAVQSSFPGENSRKNGNYSRQTRKVLYSKNKRNK